MRRGSWVVGRIAPCATVLLLASMALGSPFPSRAVPRPPTPDPGAKLLVVVANRLTLDDFDNLSLPNITKLFRHGSVGLVSPNCPRPRTVNSVLLTASAGTGCSGGPFVRELYVQEFYDADEMLPTTHENAGVAYAARTGGKAPPGSAVFLGLGPVIRAVEEAGRSVRLGAVGDALHRAGLRTAVVGNADSLAMPPDRAVSVLAMDSEGLIDTGRLAARYAPCDPCGLVTDVDGLAKTTLECVATCDLVIVSFGDSTRLDDSKINLSDKAFASHKAAMMRRLDRLVGKLLAAHPGIALVSFSPSLGGYWDRLTPIAIYFGHKQNGLLVSATTRTPGLIAASDFAPTVLSYLRAPIPKGVTGSAARVVGGFSEPDSALRQAQDGALRQAQDGDDRVRRTLLQIDKRVAANHTLIFPLLWAFVGVGAICLTIAALLIAFNRPISHKLSRALRFGLLFSASSYVAMLLAVLAPPGAAYYASAAVVITLAVAVTALLASRNSSPAGPVLVVFGVTVLTIVIDALTGCGLCKFALPSSYQLDGFRYYGIGNEYGAAFVSMSALLALFSAPRLRGVFAAALGVIVVIVLGVGSLGANYGDAAAAIVTFGLIGYAVRRSAFGARHVAGAVVLAVMLVAGFALADWAISGARGTHAGRLVGGMPIGQIAGMAARKLLMNLCIAGTRQAQRAYVAFAPFVALWFWGVQRKVKDMVGGDRQLVAGLKAVLVGSAAAFLMNDSGVVMAAIMISMTILILVYSLLSNLDSPTLDS